MSRGRHIVEAVRLFVVKFANDWSMNLASMIAYNLITAIFPILLVILSIAGMILGRSGPADIKGLAHAISRAFPTRQGGIDITPLLQSLVGITGPLAAVSLVTLLWLGSNLFANVENAFSIIFRVRGRDIIPQRVMAIGMVLILTVLLPISLGAASFVTAGTDAFGAFLPHRLGLLLTYVGPLTSLGVLWLLFLVIYIVVPNMPLRFRYAWRGALVAALLFGVFNVLFPLYFTIFLNGNTRYGAAAAAILVTIIWLWFFALITVIGAQINAVAMGLQATPYDVARAFELAYDDYEAEVRATHEAESRATSQAASGAKNARSPAPPARAPGGKATRGKPHTSQRGRRRR